MEKHLNHFTEPIFSTVNSVCCCGLNHQQVHEFSSARVAEYPDVVYATAVQWCNPWSSLISIFELWTKTELFLNEKNFPQTPKGFGNSFWLRLHFSMNSI